MLPSTWNSPDGKIFKQIINEGVLGLKPTENSKCHINIKDCDSDLSILTQTSFHVVGQSDSQIQRLLDNCLMTMRSGEIAKVTFHLDFKYTFTLELINFETEDLICKWSAKKKFELSAEHKARGVELFQESRYVDASCRFGKALKILCSIPIEIDPPFSEIDGVSLTDIQRLKTNLYNNLGSCYLKCKQYQLAANFCRKIFETDKFNLKALYKYGVAAFEMQDYEISQQSFLTLLKFEPDNKAVASKLKLANSKVAESNTEINAIIKKMFAN